MYEAQMTVAHVRESGVIKSSGIYSTHTHTHTCGDEAEGLKKEKHHKKNKTNTHSCPPICPS